MLISRTGFGTNQAIHESLPESGLPGPAFSFSLKKRDVFVSLGLLFSASLRKPDLATARQKNKEWPERN